MCTLIPFDKRENRLQSESVNFKQKVCIDLHIKRDVEETSINKMEILYGSLNNLNKNKFTNGI